MPDVLPPINRVCGIVVTFRPEKDVLDNLAALRPQVETVVVVDNGSHEDTLAWLRPGVAEAGCEFIENGDNLGIGAALNIGVRWAKQNGFKFVLLFDQDSTVAPGFVDSLVHAYENNRDRDRLAIIVPSYVHKKLNIPVPNRRASDGTLEVAMTSGSLMPVTVFDTYGYFKEDLFIDCVDYEYCLRVRAKGQIVIEVAEAVLNHGAADPTVYKLFGKKVFQTGNQSPLRRYYTERNKVWLIRTYWRVYPSFCARMMKVSVKTWVKIALVESNRLRKLYHSVTGVADGLRGRLGRNVIL